MRRKKAYGQSRIDACPFCSRQAVARNGQGIPVCETHKRSVLNDMRCICGRLMEFKHGRYGVFCLCLSCGPRSLEKAFETNEIRDVS